jgi:hypothetical protein
VLFEEAEEVLVGADREDEALRLPLRISEITEDREGACTDDPPVAVLDAEPQRKSLERLLTVSDVAVVRREGTLVAYATQ